MSMVINARAMVMIAMEATMNPEITRKIFFRYLKVNRDDFMISVI